MTMNAYTFVSEVGRRALMLRLYSEFTLSEEEAERRAVAELMAEERAKPRERYRQPLAPLGGKGKGRLLERFGWIENALRGRLLKLCGLDGDEQLEQTARGITPRPLTTARGVERIADVPMRSTPAPAPRIAAEQEPADVMLIYSGNSPTGARLMIDDTGSPATANWRRSLRENAERARRSGRS
jgi:hypothetical protein